LVIENFDGNGAGFRLPHWTITPTAGSRVITPRYRVAAGTTLTVKASSTAKLVMVVREDVRQNARND
jgi:hypothetical protein